MCEACFSESAPGDPQAGPPWCARLSPVTVSEASTDHPPLLRSHPCTHIGRAAGTSALGPPVWPQSCVIGPLGADGLITAFAADTTLHSVHTRMTCVCHAYLPFLPSPIWLNPHNKNKQKISPVDPPPFSSIVSATVPRAPPATSGRPGRHPRLKNSLPLQAAPSSPLLSPRLRQRTIELRNQVGLLSQIHTRLSLCLSDRFRSVRHSLSL